MKKTSLISGYFVLLCVIIALVSVAGVSCNHLAEIAMEKATERFQPKLIRASDIEIERYFSEELWMVEDFIGSAVTSPTLADLDGDKDLEIIVISDRDLIYILDHEGNFLSGWGNPFPVGVDGELSSLSGFAPQPVTIDLDGDGVLEILCAAYDGTIHAWFLNTTEVPGWKFSANGKITGSPAVGDIDGDKENEIIVATWNSTVYAYEKNGSIVAGFPYSNFTQEVLGTPSVGNLDADEALEIIFGTYNNSIYAINGDGTLLPHWPVNTSNFVRASPSIADIDNDTINEVIIGSWDRNLYVLRNNGSNYGDWPLDTGNSIINSASLGDLDQDGITDFVVQPSNVTLYSFTEARNQKTPNWTASYAEGIYQDTVIANINSDPQPEIITVTNTGKVRIYSASGSELLTQELTIKGFSNHPSIGDIDGDNYVEIIFATNGNNEQPSRGEIFAYKLGAFGLLPWQGYRGGLERIGKPLDSDQDGLSDFEETMLGTNSSAIDSDNDGIIDGEEIYKYALNPVIADANEDYDNDWLSNLNEVDIYGTDPTNEDSDGDNLIDGQEVLTFGTDPLDSDTDNDLVPDGFEAIYTNPDPLVPDATEDLDEDNLNNFEEYDQDTNPDNNDTDGDSLLDGDEVKKYYTNPLVQDADLDGDGDGLINVDEVDLYGTDPRDSDTDGDGYSDGFEIARGSDPNDPRSKPFPMWTLGPIIAGSLIIIGTASYFIAKKVIRKKQKEV